MRVLILGAGNCGLLAAVHFYRRGCEVCCYTRDPQKAAVLNRGPLPVEGVIQTGCPLRAVTDVDEAMNFADLILVCTPANAHRDIYKKIQGRFRKGQMLLILNGNFGAYEARVILGEEIREKDLRVGETASQPFLGTFTGSSLQARAVKETLSLAGLNPEDTEALGKAIAPYWNKIHSLGTVLDTSLSGANPLIHAALAVFNITRIERGEEFLILAQAPDRAISYIEQLDLERQKVGQALGIAPVPLLQELLSFWTGQYHSLAELFRNHPLYAKKSGPRTLDHRFIREDIPYGIMPIRALGEMAGVDTPYAGALEQLMCLYLGTRFETEAIAFDPVIIHELTGRRISPCYS
jgi:opine dehydrogenase